VAAFIEIIPAILFIYLIIIKRKEMKYINPNNSFRNRFNKPLSVYVNWAAYDELSDNVRLNRANCPGTV
jgi:hypothetical protein